MGLNFVTDLPEDSVQPRSGHTETARELKSNPTDTGWADITKEGGYSKRATATAFAKEINDHTHDAYRDYGFEATVRSVATGKTDDEGKPVQVHTLYARYNPNVENAGKLAPKVEKVKKAKATEAVSDDESAPETVTETEAPADGESALSLPAMGQTDAPAPARPARARAAK